MNSDRAKTEEGPTNTRVVAIPYEGSSIELPIAKHAEIAELKPPYIEPLSDQQLIESLRNPIGTRALSEIVRGRKNVLIIMENATRPLNTSFIASLVIEELRRAGIADENITFLFANGAHKEMDEYNYKRKLGERFKNFKVANHDCEGELVNLGETSLGSPILINPLVLEAEVKIAIGTIEPHYGDGVSGGAKILFPGCAGLDWIFNNHSLKRGEFGQVDNEWRNDTEESAGKVGIDFLVNAVLNYRREVIGLYCGHWMEAHRAGVSLSLKASEVKLPYKADFCIASSSPFDLNFIQTLKGIEVTRTVIKEGGSYVMLTSCPQGLGNHRWLLDEKMLEIRRKQNADYDSAITEIIYSTHLSEAELHSYYPLGPGLQQVRLVDDIGELRRVIASFDKPGSKGIILPYAPITTLLHS
ncbi:MAG: lactate racemase domain-containing protein [Planctomycetota bacterium]